MASFMGKPHTTTLYKFYFAPSCFCRNLSRPYIIQYCPPDCGPDIDISESTEVPAGESVAIHIEASTSSGSSDIIMESAQGMYFCFVCVCFCKIKSLNSKTNISI